MKHGPLEDCEVSISNKLKMFFRISHLYLQQRGNGYSFDSVSFHFIKGFSVSFLQHPDLKLRFQRLRCWIQEFVITVTTTITNYNKEITKNKMF